MKMRIETVNVSEVKVEKTKRGRKADPAIAALVNSVRIAPNGKGIRVMAQNEEESAKNRAKISAAFRAADMKVVIGRIEGSSDLLVTKKTIPSA